MRDRLVAAFVGLTFAVIALYGVPRAFYLVDMVETRRQEAVDHAAAYSAATVAAVLEDGEPVTDAVLGRALEDGQRVTYTAATGEVRTVPEGTAPQPDDLAHSEPVPGGEVTVTFSRAALDREVREALTPLIVLGLVLLPLAAGAGWLLARRLSRPFTELAGVARAIGTGDLAISVPRHRIPEAEAIGRALEDSAHRLETMIRREREVAVHASHELRTPITALRLTLEDLALWPQTDPEVADELHRIVAEVDRFSDAVTALLEESRSGRMQEAELLDVGGLTLDAVDRWAPVASGIGLSMEAGADQDAATAELPRAAVTQAVDLLLQHACEVASGTIRVACRDRGSHLAVEVAFAERHPDWRGAPAAVALRQAAELAASVGGRLTHEPPQDGSVDLSLVLLLPSALTAQTVHTADSARTAHTAG